ncbi:MAG TPA: hypothetical protein VJC39_03250 [Candidatus Nanoarchaeia archaeon]|nr:hypothetical protein [Candidatus Nanoarchaeia archaeon]
MVKIIDVKTDYKPHNFSQGGIFYGHGATTTVYGLQVEGIDLLGLENRPIGVLERVVVDLFKKDAVPDKYNEVDVLYCLVNENYKIDGISNANNNSKKSLQDKLVVGDVLTLTVRRTVGTGITSIV